MGKRISELAIATSVSDADYIPCVQGGVTKRATRAALYPDDAPVDTSSRIIDLTGDRAPAIPDDPAGVTYQNIQNFTSADGWTATRCTLSYSGGKMIITATDALPVLLRTVTASTLVIAKIRKVSGSATDTRIANTAGTIYSSVKSFDGRTEHVHATYIGAGATGSISIYVGNVGSAAGDVYEISFIYIGTGAYLSKLVDRAGVPWTNNGALPVPGPFGKGLQFNGAQYLQAPGPMTGIVGTIAIHGKHKANGERQVCFFNDNGSGLNGQRVYISSANKTSFLIGGVSAFTTKENDTLADGEEYTQVVTFEGTTYKYSVNGGPVTTGTLVQAPGLSSVNAWIGRTTIGTAYNVGTIYALRADSRVWTDDEIARWSRDPYSEDSGLIDAFSLDFTNLPTFADNAAAIAGNLPAGKLYRTSTGNVLVRC